MNVELKIRLWHLKIQKSTIRVKQVLDKNELLSLLSSLRHLLKFANTCLHFVTL